LYGKLGWGFVGRSDMCFNVRIGDNKVRAVRLEKKEEVFDADDLNKYFHSRKYVLIYYKMISPKG
jgi:hypothetical protein